MKSNFVIMYHGSGAAMTQRAWQRFKRINYSEIQGKLTCTLEVVHEASAGPRSIFVLLVWTEW